MAERYNPNGMTFFDSIQRHCLAKPEATEDYPWGDVAWKVRGKMFAATSPDSNQVGVKSTLEKQAVLIQHPNVEIAHYVGRYGWVTVTVVDKDTLQLLLELIDESYEMVEAKAPGRAKRKGKPSADEG